MRARRHWRVQAKSARKDEQMAMDGDNGRGPAADRPAKSARVVWLIGLVLLALVVIIAIRAFVAGSSEPTAANADKAPITETDQAIAGTEVENGGGQ
jgi:hypothetical protein